MHTDSYGALRVVGEPLGGCGAVQPVGASKEL